MPAAVATSDAPPRISRLLTFLDRWHRPLLAALIILGTARIALTYHVFNHTSDEPAHIACGMEWLDKQVYQWEVQHPPLARVASALGPYLLGIRSQGTQPGFEESMWVEGTSVLYKDNHYDISLTAARAGILPFFWIACLVVYYWGKREFNPRIGLLAVFFFSFIPTVLAHSGLATTDVALTAFLGLSFLTGIIWVEDPTSKHAVWLGVAGGLAVLSKFSSLLFFPSAAGLAIGYYAIVWGRGTPWWEAIRKRVPSLAVAAMVACVVVWAGYRFSFGHVDGLPFSVPAPELFKGIQEVQKHNAQGHLGYLLGENRMHGWWYFFEVALLVKTPIAFLVLMTLGCAPAMTRRSTFPKAWLPLCFSSSILIVSAFGGINIGLRHVLPVFIGFSILAALALDWLLQRPAGWSKVGAGILVAWFMASSLLAHPDYLAYFNEVAGSHPENILVDSDLDWGQDMKRLSNRLRELGAKEVTVSSLIIADFDQLGFPNVKAVRVDRPEPGWNAVGFTKVKHRFAMFVDRPDVTLWIDTPPREQVGKSMLLWYFAYPKSDPAQPSAGAPAPR